MYASAFALQRFYAKVVDYGEQTYFERRKKSK